MDHKEPLSWKFLMAGFSLNKTHIDPKAVPNPFPSSPPLQNHGPIALTKGKRSKRQLSYPLPWPIYVFNSVVNTKLPTKGLLFKRRP